MPDTESPTRQSSGDEAPGATGDDAQELSQTEVESLLTQASELSSGDKADDGQERPSPVAGEAAAPGDASVFADDAAPIGFDAEKPALQERIMSDDEAVDMLGDIPIDISVELGRVKLSIGELIDLRSGAIVDLDRLAGEPVDILANGTLIARGEVVVVNDCYSVRITEIVDKDV